MQRSNNCMCIKIPMGLEKQPTEKRGSVIVTLNGWMCTCQVINSINIDHERVHRKPSALRACIPKAATTYT